MTVVTFFSSTQKFIHVACVRCLSLGTCSFSSISSSMKAWTSRRRKENLNRCGLKALCSSYEWNIVFYVLSFLFSTISFFTWFSSWWKKKLLLFLDANSTLAITVTENNCKWLHFGKFSRMAILKGKFKGKMLNK